MRWTALHACITGWAEKEAEGTMSNGRLKQNPCARRALELNTHPTSTSSSSPSSVSTSLRRSGSAMHREVLLLLLKNHAFVDCVDINCRSPLMLAAASNLPSALELLLEHGADINSRDLDGHTALHLAYAASAATSIGLLEQLGGVELTEVQDNKGRVAFDLAGKLSSVSSIFSK